MNAMVLTAHDAGKYAAPAPFDLADQIVHAGLAATPMDVVILGTILYARARLPSGDPAAFYLRVGTIEETPETVTSERLEMGGNL